MQNYLDLNVKSARIKSSTFWFLLRLEGISLVNLVGFVVLLQVNLKIREITGNMFKGNITKNPVKSGSYTSCDYCGFKDVCRFDPINRNNRAKRLAQNFEEDAFEEIRTQTAIYRGESTGEQNGASEQ